MPISSGAKGHVGVGVDTSIKWLPEGGGGRDNWTVLCCKNTNSYLQRYLCSNPEARKRINDETSTASDIPTKTKTVCNIISSSKSSIKQPMEPQYEYTLNKLTSTKESPRKQEEHHRDQQKEQKDIMLQQQVVQINSKYPDATYQRNHKEQITRVTHRGAETSSASPAFSTTKGKNPVTKATKSSVCILL